MKNYEFSIILSECVKKGKLVYLILVISCVESPEPATVFVSLSWSLKTGFHNNNSSGILEFVTVIWIFHYAYDHNLHNRATCY